MIKYNPFRGQLPARSNDWEEKEQRAIRGVTSVGMGAATGALIAVLLSSEKDRGRAIASGLISGGLAGAGLGTIRVAAEQNRRNEALNRDTRATLDKLNTAVDRMGGSKPNM